MIDDKEGLTQRLVALIRGKETTETYLDLVEIDDKSLIRSVDRCYSLYFVAIAEL